MKVTQPQLPLGAEAVVTADPRLLTVRQAAQVLRLGRSTVYELIAAGELETVSIGRSGRVPLDALRAALRRPV
jgi:excisionase family DNA binding protein